MTQARVYTITIPNWKPPTLNSTMRGTIRDRIKHGKSCREMVRYYARAAAIIPQALGARRVTISITFPNRRHIPDPDSIAKSMLDSLKHAGMIFDDTYEYVVWEPPVFEIGDRLETRITLQDIPKRSL